ASTAWTRPARANWAALGWACPSSSTSYRPCTGQSVLPAGSERGPRSRSGCPAPALPDLRSFFTESAQSVLTIPARFPTAACGLELVSSPVGPNSDPDRGFVRIGMRTRVRKPRVGARTLAVEALRCLTGRCSLVNPCVLRHPLRTEHGRPETGGPEG